MFRALFRLAVVFTFGLLPFAAEARQECSFAYSIDIVNLKVGEANHGVAEVRCSDGRQWNGNPRFQMLYFLAFNRTEWAAPTRERASLNALADPKFGEPSFDAGAFLQVLLQTNAAEFKTQPAATADHKFAAILRAQGFYQDDMSVVVHEGTGDGFALKRGFQDWAFLFADGQIMANAWVIQVRYDCKADPQSILSLRECLVYRGLIVH